MRNALSISLIALIAGTPAWADSRSLRWSELPLFLANHSIALTLPDGARIEGKAVAVEPDQLVIDVHKTSEPAAHAKGRQSIPRDQAARLIVNRPTTRWRVIGIAVGGAAGVPLGAVAALDKDGVLGRGNGGVGLFVASVAGLAAIGFLIGWAADHRKTEVTIMP